MSKIIILINPDSPGSVSVYLDEMDTEVALFQMSERGGQVARLHEGIQKFELEDIEEKVKMSAERIFDFLPE